MNLNLHARIEVALIVTMLLGSCSGLGPVTRDEVIDIADDAVGASDLGGRLEVVENRIEELESKVRLNEVNIDTAFSNAASNRETANRNSDLMNRFKDNTMERLNLIESRLNM